MIFDTEEFQQLRALIFRLISKDTKWFINLEPFNALSEKHLTKFLQIDNLSIEEFHTWNVVLGWMFAKNVNLDPMKKVSQWSDQELNCCRVFKTFVPFIRFFRIFSLK
jgi:hypothetical protein